MLLFELKDNSSTQNQNWLFFSFLVKFMNQEWGSAPVIMKCFELDCCFMKADSVHGSIGSEWKKRSEILDIANVLKLQRKPTEIASSSVWKSEIFANLGMEPN